MNGKDITIVMTQQLKEIIRKRANQEAPNEICFVIGGHLSRSAMHCRFLATKVFFAELGDYEIQHPAACRLKPEFLQGVLLHCAEEQLHIVYDHTHPFDHGSPHESGTDLNAAAYMPEAISEACPGMLVMTMVIGGNFNGVEAHVYNPSINQREPVDKLLVFEQGKLDISYPTSSALRNNRVQMDEKYLSRLSLAFGKEAVFNNRNLRIGAIGCGSLGEPVIAQLANLGFKLTLGDMDEFCIENANRSLFGNQITATRKITKAELCRRAVLQTNPDADVRIVHGDIREPEIQKQFLDCDLLVVTTDNETSRIVANYMAMTHGMVLFDVGTGIIVNDGKLEAVHGQVVKVIPGSNLCHECSEFFDTNAAHQGLLSEEDFELARSRGYVEGEEMPAPSVLPLNMTMAGIAVWEILRYVTGATPGNVWDILTVDLLNSGMQPHYYQRREDGQRSSCVLCSHKGVLMEGENTPPLVRNKGYTHSKATEILEEQRSQVLAEESQ